MPHDANQDLSRLHEFMDQAGPGLGLSPGDIPIEDVLDLSSKVARAVMRPGVPVTAYAVGLAVGRGMAFEAALSVAHRHLGEFAATHGENPERRR